VIDDWGGRDATFEIVVHDPPRVLVHRLAGLRRRRLAEVGGGLLDLVTVAALAAGLRERLRGPRA
jgi:hypothetical protein